MNKENDENPKSEPDEQKSVPQGPPPTPFDHPLFLPVLLFAGMLWFGYDGWIETDPEMLEHRTFNRIGFGVLSGLTAWFGYKGINEYRAEQEERARGQADTNQG